MCPCSCEECEYLYVLVCLHVQSCIKKCFLVLKGADKTVKAPDGSSCVDVAEKEEIKKLLMS